MDADACPIVVKEILFRAAERVRVTLTMVANQPQRTPPSRYIRTIQVPGGMDVADNRIVQLMGHGDLVITADIPLAADVVRKGGYALNPRGELYTDENIGERLAMRNLLDELRNNGMKTNCPSPLSRSNRQAFANALDRVLAKRAVDLSTSLPSPQTKIMSG